jgi:hypothetical protein
MKIAYFDCFSGISGDMALGALLDLGLPKPRLLQELKKLPLPDFDLEVSFCRRMNLRGKKVTVRPRKEEEERTFWVIKSMLEKSSLNSEVKELSIKIFEKLAKAEAKIHQQKIDEVHFHEVGAIDSLVDIVGVGVGIDHFRFDKVYVSSLPLGSGFVTCRHGVIPLPAPATVELLKGVPVHSAGMEGELVTPTGAAIIKVIATEFGSIPPMKIDRIGYGVGAKNFKERPNLLRIISGEPEGNIQTDRAIVIETNVDDMSSQIHGYLMERLFELGAFDVSFFPVQMKKNRPGVILRVICEEGRKLELIKNIFKETTTLGIRCYEAERFKLSRWSEELPTRYGPILVKVVENIDGEVEVFPEYEECKKVAREKGVALKEVYRAVRDDSRSFKPRKRISSE